MARFRDIRALQKFASAHASICNHFNQDRHLNGRDTFKNGRDTFKQNRAVALIGCASLRPESLSFSLFEDRFDLV